VKCNSLVSSFRDYSKGALYLDLDFGKLTFSFFQYCQAFMYTGTTNLVAAAQETDRGLHDKPTASRSMITAIQLSGYVGAGLGAILFVFARQLLTAIIGNAGIGPEVFGPAMRYVRIRALGMPAAAIIGSAQAGCLGMQDIRTPLYVLGAAALVNFMGDILFVGSSHSMFGGAAGAAWATVISQYVAVASFLHWLCNKPRSETKRFNLIKMQGQNKTLANKGKNFATKISSITKKFGNGSTNVKSQPRRKTDVSFSTRGLLDGRMRGLDMLKFPKLEDAKQFAPYLVPVTATQVGRVSGYVAMSHVVSSSLGTISMAAQQVVVALFYCLCPIADSLSLTAQSFLPVLFGKPRGKERADALRTTFRNFLKAGGIFGAIMSTVVLAIPLVSKFFTTDPAVCAAINMVTPLLFGIVSVHGILCSMEGIILGQRDLAYLGKMYASFFFVVPYFMLRVKKAAFAGQPVNLTSVWTVFLGYQWFRCAAWVGRVMYLQGRTDRAVSSLEDAIV
jgi:Na+-driven multidrug efflux pump